MDELSTSARLAHRALKIILIPVMIFVGVTHFTPPQWYWADFVSLALLVLTVILVIVGRVFTSRSSSEGKAQGDNGENQR